MNSEVLKDIVWQAILEDEGLTLKLENAGVFKEEVSPIVGVKSVNQHCFDELHVITASERIVLLFTEKPLPTFRGWEKIDGGKMQQMVLENPSNAVIQNTTKIIPLTDALIPEMLALTALTKPGPFVERTLDFGHYHGIFEKGKLVAMAGLRLQVSGYKEISAVCTHPDFMGKGYARALMQFMMSHIQSLNCIPFLHVKKDNYRPIRLYEKLGFKFSGDYYYNVFKRIRD
jgi:ribosomal protein S18 acetylase RimI-like enzyme